MEPAATREGLSRARRLASTGGRVLGAAVIAVIVGFIAAPQALAVVVWVAGGWMPAWLERPLAHLGYEAGLWGSGLATFLVAQRLGWLHGRRAAVAVTAFPPFVETALPLTFGLLAPGFSTWTGFLVRLLVGVAAVAAAVTLTRPPKAT